MISAPTENERTVTGMTKYIELDLFLKNVKHNAPHIYSMVAPIALITPAADVAPVRNGRWETMHYEGGILDCTNFDKCSVCGYERVFEDENLKTAFVYCPACGAKMDLEDSQCDT